MRLGVLDVGSNTVHLLVVDAHRGGHPTPHLSEKATLKLATQLDADGALTAGGTQQLVDAVQRAAASARDLGCDELLPFATSAVREATNSTSVLDVVRAKTGVDLMVLSGEQEARLTFLAARRWFGWSSGNLLVIDIGGGSLEVAAGRDEEPDVAVSLPLGAGRLRRERLVGDPPEEPCVATLRRRLAADLALAADRIRIAGPYDKAVATSKTFRMLARLGGAAPSSAGPQVPRTLTAGGLRKVTALALRTSAAKLGELDGVSPDRSDQVAGGALVAEAAMAALRIDALSVCPWALREGVILQRLDQLAMDSAAAGGIVLSSA